MTAKQAGNKRVVKTTNRGTNTSQKKSSADAKPRVGSIAQASSRSKSNESLPFTRKNYLLLILGVGIIALGFFLMTLEPFIDATKFSIALYIAPIIVVGGFVEIIFAIMYQEKGAKKSEVAEME
jgi:hypothetical protein